MPRWLPTILATPLLIARYRFVRRRTAAGVRPHALCFEISSGGIAADGGAAHANRVGRGARIADGRRIAGRRKIHHAAGGEVAVQTILAGEVAKAPDHGCLVSRPLLGAGVVVFARAGPREPRRQGARQGIGVKIRRLVADASPWAQADLSRYFLQTGLRGSLGVHFHGMAFYVNVKAALRKGSFAPIGPGTVPVETVKVIRPNHVSGLSRINVLQCRKRCTGQQKGSPFCPFRETIRKSVSFSLCRGGRDVRRHHHQKQKQ